MKIVHTTKILFLLTSYFISFIQFNLLNSFQFIENKYAFSDEISIIHDYMPIYIKMYVFSGILL